MKTETLWPEMWQPCIDRTRFSSAPSKPPSIREYLILDLSSHHRRYRYAIRAMGYGYRLDADTVT